MIRASISARKSLTYKFSHSHCRSTGLGFTATGPVEQGWLFTCNTSQFRLAPLHNTRDPFIQNSALHFSDLILVLHTDAMSAESNFPEPLHWKILVQVRGLPWLQITLLSPFLLLLSIFLRRTFAPGLKDVPGPFWAKYFGAWRVWFIADGRHPFKLVDLHRKLGPLVRIGPRHVSVGDAKEIPVIYGFNTKYHKVTLNCELSPVLKVLA